MRRSIGVAVLLAALAPAGRPAVAAAGATGWAAVLERYAPAVVNLRLTLASEVEGSGAAPEETKEEVRGTIVDPGGLILVWNSHVSAGRMSDLFAGAGPDGGGLRLRVTPTDVRVTLPGETRERPAFLAASDSALDLAFIQLEETPDAPLPAIDFSQPAVVAVGDELATVSRLSSRFDRAPYFDTIRVGGELRKPRPAWILSGGNASQAGMPYFAKDGRVAGVLTTVLSRAGDPADGNPGKLFAELISLGRGLSEVGPVGLFLLPAERVHPVIGQARERAHQMLEERRAAVSPAAD